MRGAPMRGKKAEVPAGGKQSAATQEPVGRVQGSEDIRDRKKPHSDPGKVLGCNARVTSDIVSAALQPKQEGNSRCRRDSIAGNLMSARELRMLAKRLPFGVPQTRPARHTEASCGPQRDSALFLEHPCAAPLKGCPSAAAFSAGWEPQAWGPVLARATLGD